MSRQLYVALSLTALEKSQLDAIRKQLGCSRTEVVNLALQKLIKDYHKPKEN